MWKFTNEYVPNNTDGKINEFFFHLENFRLIEKNFVSFTKYMEAMALIKFQLNLSI